MTRWEKVGTEGLCVVERYDRVRSDDRITRLHQEDLCQALGIASTSKYEQEGGPSFSGCVDVVRDHSFEPLTDTQALLRWLAFNVIAGNADGHAKNLSLLYDDGWRLAPFYDLVCTRSYDRIERRLAMSIGNESDPNRLRKLHFENCAREVGVRPAWLLDNVRTMADTIMTELPAAVATCGVARSPAVELITP
ncbi:MAG TPA: HipA domain-containing protein, partial [Labilithrix sp.]|nr:HipA domain-containing protein [Labilithrix sp.]